MLCEIWVGWGKLYLSSRKAIHSLLNARRCSISTDVPGSLVLFTFLRSPKDGGGVAGQLQGSGCRVSPRTAGEGAASRASEPGSNHSTKGERHLTLAAGTRQNAFQPQASVILKNLSSLARTPRRPGAGMLTTRIKSGPGTGSKAAE